MEIFTPLTRCLWLLFTLWSGVQGTSVEFDIPQTGTPKWQVTFPGVTKCSTMSWTLNPAPPYYGSDPIIGTVKSSFAANVLTSEAQFRGFDNMMLENGVWQEKVTKQYVQNVTCTPEGGTPISKTATVTATAVASSPRTSTWTRSGALALPCIISGTESVVPVVFTKNPADPSSPNNKLIADWKKGQPIPWLASRPASASRTTTYQTGTQRVDNYDGSSSDIIFNSITTNASGTLLLGLAPPSRPGFGIAEWIVCFYPGDMYNYYEKICTDPFLVADNAQDCATTTIAPTTTLQEESDSSGINSGSNSGSSTGWVLFAVAACVCCCVPLFVLAGAFLFCKDAIKERFSGQEEDLGESECEDLYAEDVLD